MDRAAFDAGARLDLDAMATLLPGRSLALADLAAAQPGDPDHLRFRLLRPADLLVMTVEAVGLGFEDAPAGEDEPAATPHLVPTGADARLAVVFGYQHVAEKARFEQNGIPDPPEPGDAVPVAARAARKSRLVFKVPAGERIPFSTEGVLAALSRLEMAVVPVATPRGASLFTRVIRREDALIELASGLGLAERDGQLFLQSVARQGGAVKAVTARSVIAAAGALHDLRGRASQASIVDARAEAGHSLVDEARLVGLVPSRIPPVFRFPVARPRRPTDAETAIEAPFRLSISPSALNGWTHAREPVAAPSDANRIELWHSRLGVRQIAADGAVTIDERDQPQKIIRAIWARELELPAPPAVHSNNDPFRQSLDGLDRVILVRQSAETLVRPTVRPEPVSVRGLALSSVGAWLDLFGRWETEPYTAKPRELPAIQSWDHVATMGRDQYVRVAYPGYLFPFGHKAVLVKITERKIKETTDPEARMYQRKFIVVSEPVRYFTGRDLPFTEVRLDPLVTPDLKDPLGMGAPEAPKLDQIFWPNDAAGLFRWKLHARDQEGKAVRLDAPLLFVAANEHDAGAITAAYADATLRRNLVPGASQSVAYAPPLKPGDTASETASLTFAGTPGEGTSVPRLDVANVVLPAMRHLAPASPETVVRYTPLYVNGGFDAANPGNVFLDLVNPLKLQFGSTEHSGGFIKPDIGVAALSRVIGLAGDSATVAANKFDPAKFLQGVVPKLFGLFDLIEILADLGLDLTKAPSFITETLNKIAGLVDDLSSLEATLADAAAVTTGAAQAKYNDLKAEIATELPKLQNGLADLLALNGAGSLADVAAKVQAPLAALSALIAAVRQALATFPTSPAVKTRLDRLSNALQPILADAGLINDVLQFVNGLNPGGGEFRAHLEWKPVLKPWPSSTAPVFAPPPDGLTLAVEVRASAKGEAGVDVFAELRDFKLRLMPGEPLMQAGFTRIAFRGGSNRKPEVDVVFDGLEFLGFLSFIETLKELIPLDGFSDPPFLDVTAEGVTAGFTISLPNLAIGVFSLTNLALGADTRIPFLGKAVTVGFSFCSRERPFTLAVAFLGGGGFFAIRLSPQGLEVLEMSLEFGAVLALDFGVASGSVSAMGGVYIRLEGDAGSLTGYFRVRGEVDVLSLISASIELYMALTYEFQTGKMIGKAELTVSIKILFFSASVKISCERKFAGSNGDPTVAEMLDVQADGSSAVWDEYCLAFAA